MNNRRKTSGRLEVAESPPAEPFCLFLLEDDEVDIHALRRCLQRSVSPCVLDACMVPAETLGRLRAAVARHRGRVVLVVDLKLPGCSGLDMLRQVRGHPDLHTVPALVMSTSSDERDRHAAFAAGAAGYFTKPVDPESYTTLVSAICTYWACSAYAPPQK